ncbi:gamma-glutamylcyclotransferase family protein [Spirillospora sp. NPDC047279]|uniref:gamma-glutamylcyclotransferase family protein n=1 Tax=Spirillospora sp. NPDC047279 TaxID=3155478 RepID=UPI0033F3BACB
MSAGLFVYGTLRFPAVLAVLLGRVPALAPATAAGWRVRALPGVVYPGLVADPGGVAEGLLVTGLDDAERRLLDAYEDDLYEPTLLALDDGREAWAYVWRDATEPYDWDAAHFAEHELDSYTEGCRLWRSEMSFL